MLRILSLSLTLSEIGGFTQRYTMEKIKVLNLYAGIGGNRKLWKNVDVTAVENNKEIADIYKDFFPEDEVIIADAHQFLLEHHKEFDFIWSSPPCQSHSSFRHNICVKFRGTEAKYPDMNLYEEILFLKHHAKCKWVVENVKPYYEPLIKGNLIQRHMFWSNFPIEDIKLKQDNIRQVQIPELEKIHGFILDRYKLKNKRQILRNCVIPKLGLHIFNSAYKSIQQTIVNPPTQAKSKILSDNMRDEENLCDFPKSPTATSHHANIKYASMAKGEKNG